MEINKKIDEYVILGMKLGFFSSHASETIYSRLRGIQMRVDNTIEENARTIIENGEHVILFNEERLKTKDDYFRDEVIFHELSHFANDIHRDLYVYGKSKIKSFKEEYKEFADGNDLIRYPEWGMFLLDEVISQYTAQEMVKEKYKNSDLYKADSIVTEYTEPPVVLYTELSNYKECYYVGLHFAETIHKEDTLLNLCKDAYDDVVIDKIFSKYESRPNGLKELYELLGYMGNVLIKDYEVKHNYTFPGSESNRDKKLVLVSIRRVMDKANQVSCA